MPLKIERIIPSLYEGCCPSNVYAVVYSYDHTQALKLSSDVYSMQAYTKVSHADFAILLTEHDQRSFLFFKNIDDLALSLPSSNDGEQYHVEIWHRNNTLGFERTDSLIDSYDFHWKDSEGIILTPITQIQLQEASGYECKVAIGYDAEELKATFVTWLSRGGSLVLDTISCEATWMKSDAEIIHQASQPSSTQSIPGVFSWNVTGLDLTPDTATVIKIKITDSNGVEHESSTAITVWD